MGGSGPYGDSFWFQYNTAWNNPGLGNSKLVSFICQSGTNNAESLVSLRAIANSYTSDRASLRVYEGPRSALDNSVIGDGLDLGGTTGDGWELRGPLIQEQRQVTGTTNCALDFDAGYCMVITPPGPSMSFFTTNRTGALTNYEHRVFVIRTGTNVISTAWPAWTWFGAAPTTIGPAQVLRLSLESVGPGETNVLAWPLLGK
jgi:hypothetical protein